MCCTSSPPTIGPAAVDAPMTAPQTPMARFSFSGGNVLRNSASAVGCSIAPNTPCSARNAMTRPRLLAMVPDRPMAAEVRAKPVTPVMKTFLCPNRSPSLPMVIRLTARASR